jgi:glutamine synthetase
MLAAGLDGIRKELPISEATEENVYFAATSQGGTPFSVLPSSLDEAISELEKDTVIREALGAHVCERFISAKRLEWEDYRIEVTPWELDKYLPIY